MEADSESVIKWLEDQFDLDQATREAVRRHYRSFDDQISDLYDPSIVHTE
jgi:hypothetical protein